MRKRIFIALPISPQLQHDILTWEQGFQNLPVRWLKGKNLHITLVPPWEEDDIAGVTKRVKEANGVNEIFELKFERVTFGPNPSKPRLIWAEGKSVHELSVLRTQIYSALNFKPDPRPFKLHLTLARFRPENFFNFPTHTLDEMVQWHDTAASFALMESHLLPGNADYETLAEIVFSPS